ncbi:MAG: 3-deoxy-D-manno-octulosonic acid kinase [Nevskiaceae bacterium]|nr:3-deoxy-D-manno-octulosonic acid kinase [Nevskiaceae bacterium]
MRRQVLSAGGARALVYSNGDADVEPNAFEHWYWREAGKVVGQAKGRGAALVFEEEGRRYVLRHYRRGGLIGKFNPDRYLWRGEAATRPLRELRLTMQLAAAGLPVPFAIGARVLRWGPFYRGDLITAMLADTRTLAQRLDEAEVSLRTWAQIGRCIRRFHDYGLYHADLNAHNILLRGDEEVYLIDFDRCRLRDPGLWRDANLARLYRSLTKLDDAREQRRFDGAQWQCLIAAWQ